MRINWRRRASTWPSGSRVIGERHIRQWLRQYRESYQPRIRQPTFWILVSLQVIRWIFVNEKEQIGILAFNFSCYSCRDQTRDLHFVSAEKLFTKFSHFFNQNQCQRHFQKEIEKNKLFSHWLSQEKCIKKRVCDCWLERCSFIVLKTLVWCLRHKRNEMWQNIGVRNAELQLRMYLEPSLTSKVLHVLSTRPNSVTDSHTHEKTEQTKNRHRDVYELFLLFLRFVLHYVPSGGHDESF